MLQYYCNSRCPKTITLDAKKCQGDIMAGMKDRIPHVAGKGEAGRPKTAYFLVTFCNFFKIRSLGSLSSVGFWIANVTLSSFRSLSWGTGSCFRYCHHCQWSGKTGKLKVTSNHTWLQTIKPYSARWGAHWNRKQMAQGAWHLAEALLVNQSRNCNVGPKREKSQNPWEMRLLVVPGGALKDFVLQTGSSLVLFFVAFLGEH